MTEFEKYLQENKQKLELDSTNPEIWLSIENEVLKDKNRKQIFYLKLMAAAAAILLGIVAVIGFPSSGKADLEAALIKKYGLEEYDFTQQVNLKKQSLSKATIPLDRKEDFEILLQQLEFLDAQYRDYLQYVDENGYQEFIGNQILYHYKSKIELLDKIQKEIEKIQYYESKYPSDSPTVELNI